MGKKLVVKLDDEAESGLNDGRYQYAKGGIINAKTKRYVQKYENTGIELKDGDVIVSSLSAKKINEMHESNGMLAYAMSRNLEFSRDSAILGLYTLQLTYDGFADISCKLEDLNGSVHAYFIQQKRSKYRKSMMNLKSVYAALMRMDTEDNEFFFSTKLNDVASFLEELFEDYESEKLDQEESAINLMNLAVALQICAEELRLYCFQKFGREPATYNDWLYAVNLVVSAAKINRAYHDRMFFSNSCASTSHIERLAKLPKCQCDKSRLKTNKMIEKSKEGMTRKDYLEELHRRNMKLSLPAQMISTDLGG